MINLLPALDHFDPQAEYVLAIVLSTEGSTYRKAGTLMLLDESLQYWGLISGGCLESDIQENAAKVFSSKRDLTLHYDMRDETDLLWGTGLGCNGAITVLLKLLSAKDNHQGFFEVLKSIDQGKNYLMQVNSDNLSTNNVNQTKPLTFSALNVVKLANRNMPSQTNGTKQSEDIHRPLSIPLLAPLRILICGASPDVPPVTALAKQLGWKSTVIDHRREMATRDRFPHAEQVKLVKRNEWPDFPLEQYAAAVIMSHQFERDQAYLMRLIESHISYIGLLGPSKRRDLLLEECQTNFAAMEGRVFGPVGLDIGADSPQTIALAIVAEIQAVRADKQVGFCYLDATR